MGRLFHTQPISNDLARYSQEVFQKSNTVLTNSSPGLAELSFSEWCFREWDFSSVEGMNGCAVEVHDR